MTKFNFVQAATYNQNNQLYLTLPNIKYEDLPSVSILTITYNRKHFFQLMYNNFKNYQYPSEKLEWVIVDDSPGNKHDLDDIIPKYPNIHYIKLDHQMLVGDKRNFGVSKCSHNIIVHQDDDDYYFPDSILAKVRILKQYPKCGCVFSNSLAVYNITNNTSCIIDSEKPESCLSLPEATMMYKKSFWEAQKFPTTQFGEGKGFVQGRQKKFVSIPCIFNMISFTHGYNLTGKTRHVDHSNMNIPTQTNVSNYFNLLDNVTQNIIKKLHKHSLSTLKPTNYNRIFLKNFTLVPKQANDFHSNNLGQELNMLSNLDNVHSFDNVQSLNDIPNDLTNDDLILVCWYSGYDMYNLFSNINASEQLPTEAIDILKHPRAKLMIYCSWECRNFITPEHKNNFFKYHSKNLQIPLEKIILASSDFLNPIIHSFSPQIIGYDFPYLFAKMSINANTPQLVDANPSDKSSAICFLTRRGSIERTSIALFLYTFFKSKSTISYLTQDSYDPNDIKQLGVPINKYKEFKKSLPLQLDYPDLDPTSNYQTENITDNSIQTLKVEWNQINQHLFDHINNSFLMLITETNAEGPHSHCQQISEKSYKPISLGMPFVIFTSKPGILKHLKSHGFKTFHPHIIEEYDHGILRERTETTEELNRQYNVRFRKLLKEINRICSMNHEQLIDLWNKCYPIVLHNLETLKNINNLKLPLIIE